MTEAIVQTLFDINARHAETARCQTSVTVGFVMIVDAVVRRVGQAIDEATR